MGAYVLGWSTNTVCASIVVPGVVNGLAKFQIYANASRGRASFPRPTCWSHPSQFFGKVIVVVCSNTLAGMLLTVADRWNEIRLDMTTSPRVLFERTRSQPDCGSRYSANKKRFIALNAKDKETGAVGMMIKSQLVFPKSRRFYGHGQKQASVERERDDCQKFPMCLLSPSLIIPHHFDSVWIEAVFSFNCDSKAVREFFFNPPFLSVSPQCRD